MDVKLSERSEFKFRKQDRRVYCAPTGTSKAL